MIFHWRIGRIYILPEAEDQYLLLSVLPWMQGYASWKR